MIARCRVSWLAGTASTPSSTRTLGKTTSNSISRSSRSSGATMRVTERGASRFEGRALAASCKPATVLTLACAIARERCSTAICPRVRRRVCSVYELVFCHRHPSHTSDRGPEQPEFYCPLYLCARGTTKKPVHFQQQRSPFAFHGIRPPHRSLWQPLSPLAPESRVCSERGVDRHRGRAHEKQSMTHDSQTLMRLNRR